MKTKTVQLLFAAGTICFGLWLLNRNGFFALMSQRLEPKPTATAAEPRSTPERREALNPQTPTVCSMAEASTDMPIQTEASPEAEENRQAEDAEEAPPEVAEALTEQRKPPHINNVSRQTPDVERLFAEDWSGALPGDGQPQILIYHTHATEAYRQDAEHPYAESDPAHTPDETKNMIRVGDELCTVLEASGLTVLHDRTMYDYPDYNGAYARSAQAVSALLEENPSIRVIIDLHRNALEGKQDDTEGAQFLLLLTTGDSGLYHPSWQENLRLGLQLQSELEADAPELTKPLYLCSARYNQQLSPGAFLLELGCNTDSLEEALESAVRFGKSAAKVLLRYIS